MSDSLSSPTASQYQPQTQIGVPPAQHPAETLPFTGWDTLALMTVAAMMLFSGAVLRRLSRQRRG